MRVEITIISHSFTLIPAVHNENGNNEKFEDDNDITIEKEEDKISRSKVVWYVELCDCGSCVNKIRAITYLLQ